MGPSVQMDGGNWGYPGTTKSSGYHQESIIQLFPTIRSKPFHSPQHLPTKTRRIAIPRAWNMRCRERDRCVLAVRRTLVDVHRGALGTGSHRPLETSLETLGHPMNVGTPFWWKGRPSSVGLCCPTLTIVRHCWVVPLVFRMWDAR